MKYTVDRHTPRVARNTLLSLWKHTMPTLSEKRVDWLYSSNPAGEATCWLARDSAAAPVGSVAILPRVFTHGARELTGGIAADYSILPDHRGFGPAIKLQRGVTSAVADGTVDFVFGTPNRSSLPVVKHVGYEVVGHMVTLTHLIQSRDALERRLPKPAASVVAPLVDMGSRLRNKWIRRRIRPSGYASSQLQSFDTRFDELWDRARANTGSLLGRRDAEFLRWRFNPSSGVTFRIFGVSEHASQSLSAYLVYHEQAGRVVIDDLLSDSSASLRALLLDFLTEHHRSRSATAITISFLGPSSLLRTLRNTGFALRDTQAQPVAVYTAPGFEREKEILDPEHWWFFSADNDV